MKTECTIAQRFGGNATDTYVKGGLKGHSGTDSSCGYASPIHAYQDGYVYKVLTKENPANDGTGFTGIFVIIENEIEVFEMLYGHCNPIVKVGDYIKCGQVIGTEANNGEVYADGIRITLDMQKAGDHRGNHRHDQKRILRKDLKPQVGSVYLTDNSQKWYQDTLGYYYAIPYYQNGYNGCVDMTLPLFNQNLTIGMSGYDVQCLQKFLKWKGFFTGDISQFFGTKTLSSVIAFQKANNLSPAIGFVGQKTRDLINQTIN